MVKTQNQTNPKFSIPKAKRNLFPNESEPKVKKLLQTKYNSKSRTQYPFSLIQERNLGRDNHGDASLEFFYTNPPIHIYKYHKSPGWGFSRAKRNDVFAKEKFPYYDQTYNKNNDNEKINKKWRSRIVGGDIGCEDRMKYLNVEGATEPGPGRYYPKDIYFKYQGNKLGGYMSSKYGKSSFIKNTGTNENVGPTSYEIGEKSNLIKFNNSPKISIGNSKRSVNKVPMYMIGDGHYIYSAFGEQIMTAKDSRPQYTIGKENRFSKASMIQ